MAPRKQHDTNDRRLNLRIPSRMYSALEVVAERESDKRGVDLSVSWAARWLLENALAEDRQPRARREEDA